MVSEISVASANKAFVEADVTTWSDADYRRLLNEIEPLFLAAKGTPESMRADALFDRIEAYEQSHFHIAEWLRDETQEATGHTSERKPRSKMGNPITV